jgi:hypothetical protein
MELTEEQLNDLEEMAAALMPPSEIAFLIHIPIQERELFCEMCKNHVNSQLYEYYQRGKLRTKYELRKTVVKLAKAGSPAAGPIAEKFMVEQSQKE